MNNFDHAIEATESGLNSAGSAAEENSRYMESLQAKITQLEASFQELSNNVLSSDLAGALLDIANSFLKLLNTPVGTFATQVALLGSAFWGGTGLLKAMKGISQLLPGFITGIKGATTATSALGAAAGLTAPQFYLISAAIVGVISLIGFLKDNIKSASEQFEESQQNLSEYNTQLDQNQQRLEELNNTPWYDRTPEIEKEIEQLKIENAELERNIELEKERSYGAAKESFSEGSYLATGVGINRVAAADIENETARYWADTFAQQDRHYATVEEAARELAYSISGTFYDTAEETRAFLESIGVNYDQLFEQQNYASEAQLSREEANKIFIKQSEDFVDRMQEEFEATGEITKETKSLYDDLIETYGFYVDEAQFIIDTQMATYGALDETGQAAQDYLDAWNSLIETYSHIDEESRKIDQAMIDSRNSINSTIDSIEQLRQEVNNLNIADVIEDTSNVLKTASDDLEQFGAIGSEAFNSLLSLAPDLTSEVLSAQLGIEGLDGALFNANGTITDAGIVALNSSGGFQALAKAVLEAQIAINNAKIEDLKTQYKEYGENAKDLADNISRMAKEYGSLSAQRKDATLAYRENYQAQLDAQQEMLMLQESSANIQSILDNWQNVVFSTGGGGGGGASKAIQEEVVDPVQAAMEQLNAWIVDQEAQLFLLEKQQLQAESQDQLDIVEAREQERIAKMQNAQKIIHNYADMLRAQGLSNEDDAIQELIQMWWDYQDKINDIQQNIADRADQLREEQLRKEQEFQQQLEEVAQERLDAYKEQIQEEIDANERLQDKLQDRIDAMEILADWMVDQIDKEISNIDDQIDALDEVNNELQEQIDLEEKLDALARARSTMMMVYKDGRFQYVSDIDAVSQAQSDLEEYEREQALQDKKDALEEEKEILQGYKDEWASLTEKYQDEQDKLLVLQQLGIDLEKENWQDRLDNFQEFYDGYADLMDQLADLVEEYNRLMDQMQNADMGDFMPELPGGIGGGTSGGNIWESVNGKAPEGAQIGDYIVTNGGTWLITGGTPGNWESQKVSDYNKNDLHSSGGGTSSSGGTGPEGYIGFGKPTGGSSINRPSSGSSFGSSNKPLYASGSGGNYQIGSDTGLAFVNSAPAGSTMTGGDGSSWTKNPDGSTSITDKYGNNYVVGGKKAVGMVYNPENTIDLVGEKGPEMRINPKGTGIIPADVTRNLWAWGMTTPAQMMANISGLSRSSDQAVMITIQNFNPSLPNVTNGEDFALYMKNNFWRQAVQFSTKRNKL